MIRILFIPLALVATLSSIACADSNKEHRETKRQANANYSPADWSPPLLLTDPISDKENPNTVDIKKEEAEKREIADLAAQEGMNRAAQRVADDTESIAMLTFWMTIATWATVVFLIPTIIFTYKANQTARANLRETERTNILQLQPWLTIGIPIISRHINRIPIPRSESGDASFRIEIPITNEGKTPVKEMRVDISYIEVQLKNSKGDKLLLKSIISTQDRTMPLNPTAQSVQIITCSCNRVSGAEQAPISDFAGDDVDIRTNIGGDVRFTDISTSNGRLKRINFFFDNIHSRESIDQFRVSDAIEEKDSSYF